MILHKLFQLGKPVATMQDLDIRIILRTKINEMMHAKYIIVQSIIANTVNNAI